MANTSSAKKRIRRDERRSHINISRRSRIRTYIKRVEAAIEEGNKDAASAALKEAQPEMMRGVSRGVYKKKHGSAENFPSFAQRSTRSNSGNFEIDRLKRTNFQTTLIIKRPGRTRLSSFLFEDT